MACTEDNGRGSREERSAGEGGGGYIGVIPSGVDVLPLSTGPRAIESIAAKQGVSIVSGIRRVVFDHRSYMMVPRVLPKCVAL